MNRVKTFNATGIAPDGRLYSGDLNAIQDAAAGTTDLAQNLSVGTVTIGETGLQFLKYAVGEVRLVGALRTDGIMRGLGGLYAGAFTTAARDALVLPPAGLIILNTTTNRLEANLGTPSVPVWRIPGGLVTNADVDAAAALAVSKLAAGSNGQYLSVVAGVPTWGAVASGTEIGAIITWPGPAGTEPAGYGFCDGGELSQATYATLYTRLGGASTPWNTFSGLPAPGAGNFRKPDLRGLFLLGNRAMGAGPTITGSRVARAAVSTLASLLGAEYHTLALAEMAAHDHSGISGTQSADHTHTGTTGTESVDHSHTVNSHSHGGGVHAHSAQGSGGTFVQYHNDQSANGTDPGSASGTRWSIGQYSTTANSAATISAEAPGTGGRSAAHTHSFTSSGMSVSHTHSIPSAGSGGAHENTPPAAVLNFLIKIS